MKFLIYGANNEISEYLKNNNFDYIIGNIDNLINDINDINITHIISFINNNDLLLCLKLNIHLTYILDENIDFFDNVLYLKLSHNQIYDIVFDFIINYNTGRINLNFPNHKSTSILITGGCGFIGSHFVNHIFNNYDQINVVNIDAMYYCASEINVNENVRNSDRYTLIKENICSKDIISNILKNHNINYVVHFAAQSHVQNSFEDSLQYTEDNILGTHTLLECSRRHNKIKRFIHVSTDEVYGESLIDNSDTLKTEFSILCPTNPYAGTKAGAELIAQTYIHSFKMPIIITRGNNVFGPNQYPEKLIPRFIKLLKENKKVTIQGNGSTVRAFLHVSDTVKAFETILLNGNDGEIYNIGCDDGMEYSVLDIAKLLISKIKNTTNYDEWIEYIEDRPFNDQRYYISNQKLKNLNWSINVDLNTGLDDIINNY